MRYNIKDFNPPLKKPLPLLHHDVSLYCAAFCERVKVWPEYLVEFKQKVTSYAKQAKRCQPKPDAGSTELRIYIFDQRLSLLFAAIDSTGKTAAFLSGFCSNYQNRDVERYCYGSGSKIGRAYPCYANGELSFEPDWDELSDFNARYGFVPIEDFAHPVVAIFQGDALVKSRPVTTAHCAALIEKFHSQNLVDLKAIVRDFYSI